MARSTAAPYHCLHPAFPHHDCHRRHVPAVAAALVAGAEVVAGTAD